MVAFVLLGVLAAPAAVYVVPRDGEWLQLLIVAAFAVSVSVTIASIGPLLERNFPRTVAASDAAWRKVGIVLNWGGAVVQTLGFMALWVICVLVMLFVLLGVVGLLLFGIRSL